MPTPSTASLVTAITGTSGNPLIDAMLATREEFSVPQAQRAHLMGLTAYKWGGDVGTPVTLSYSFIQPGASFDASYPTQYIANIGTMPDNVKDAFRGALQQWSAVANVTFQEVQETATLVGDLRFGVSASNTNFAPGQPGAEGAAPAYPNAFLAGDIWVSPTAVGSQGWDWNISGLGFMTAIHELGHAVFDRTDSTTDSGLNGAILPASLNFRTETVMSYSSIPGATAGDNPSSTEGALSFYPTTPMVLDILAAQWLYGANMSYHTGNDIYVFNPNTTYFMTIWDAGGNDTFSIAANTKGGTIDLRPGHYSDVGSVVDASTQAGITHLTQTVGIAYGTIIENAIGGSGNDTIIGNDANNVLTGGPGNDFIDGGLGVNTAAYSGPESNYAISHNSDGSWTVQDKVGTDGIDTLVNIEILKFSDLSVSLASTVPLIDALTVGQQLELIYLGYFNRSADGGGFSFWEGQNVSAQAGGQSAAVALTNIANSFTPQTETIALYPFLSSPHPNYSDPTVQAGLTTFIENVYGNLFGHTADSGGLAYWTGQIEGGAVGLGAAVLAIANGAQGSDSIILQNKIAVAIDFTTLTSQANIPVTPTFLAEAKTVLAGVDGMSLNDASVTAAEALIAPWIASHPHGALVGVVGSALPAVHSGLV